MGPFVGRERWTQFGPGFHRTLTLIPHQVDWIFFERLKLHGAQVVHVWLSDHFPVVADFELPAGPRDRAEITPVRVPRRDAFHFHAGTG